MEQHELDVIRERAANACRVVATVRHNDELWEICDSDIPLLCAEVERLQMALENTIEDVPHGQCVLCKKWPGWEVCEEAAFISDGAICLHWEYRGEKYK